jgi:ketosteroid isomerase-like protein
MPKACVVIAVLLSMTGAAASMTENAQPLRSEIDALNQSMVAAFRRAPASVAAFYTDDAAIVGGGQRHQGRAAIDAYWSGATMFKEWTLELIEHGGPAYAPWQYGRSVLVGSSGRAMETYFVGLLQRQKSGELKFRADVFVRDRSNGGVDESEHLTSAWLNATERGDATALQDVFDDQFIILSSRVANKSGEIAELVPRPGTGLPYFRSRDTQTYGFGSIAVTTGMLEWEFNGRRAERNDASVAVRRGSGWRILAQHVSPRS